MGYVGVSVQHELLLGLSLLVIANIRNNPKLKVFAKNAAVHLQTILKVNHLPPAESDAS